MRLSMNGIRVNNTAASASAIASMGGYGCKKYNVPGGDAEEFKAESVTISSGCGVIYYEMAS